MRKTFTDELIELLSKHMFAEANAPIITITMIEGSGTMIAVHKNDNTVSFWKERGLASKLERIVNAS